MVSMTHILHTEWSDGWGGQEIRILAESLEFIDRGYDVTIAAQPGSQLIQKAQESKVPTLLLEMNKGLNIGAVVRLVRFIKTNSVDIIHTHSSVDSRTGGIAGRIAGIHVVRSRHISIPVSKSRLTWFQYMKLADKVITSGEFIKNMLVSENKMLSSHIVSAPAGADQNRFTLDGNIKNIKEKYSLDGDYFIVGMVSVLRSWKGHNYVIKAFNKLKNSIPNIRLLIVGDGPKKEEIINLIKDLSLDKYVILAGHQIDPVPFYKAMDLVILPSYAGEATSQTLPQAMLMGKPVISTDVGGLPEVVINNITGLSILPKDIDSISDAISRLFSDSILRDKIAKNGREHALNFFTFEKMIDTTQGVYTELLNK
jgi:glycosyltransferase involved in cell wall biosynthesis